MLTTLWGQIFFINTFNQYLVLCCKFFSLNDFVKFDLAVIIAQGQPSVIIYIEFVELQFPMLYAKFQDQRTSGSGADFYHIWRWRPSWSCDLNHLYKFLFPLPKKAPYEI